ncbi:golgin subfamily A member 6-like protein 1 [Filimonas sp.]|nr:golgin subfamily A member 6-like protein 1 [Filimonas sp.]
MESGFRFMEICIQLYIWRLSEHHMKTQIKCPSCGHKFNLEEVLTEDVEKSIREKYEAQHKEVQLTLNKRKDELEKQLQEFEDKKKRENELFAEKLKSALEKASEQKEEEILKRVTEANQTKLTFLEQQNHENSMKLKVLNEKELQVMNLTKLLQDQKEQEEMNLLKQKAQLEIDLKKVIEEKVKEQEQEKFSFKIKELESKLSQQSKLIDEQKRKMEQGSMEQQGEIQENIIKERLISLFPFDEVSDVPKGKKGADFIHVIRNMQGEMCGQIIYESKNTKNWSNDWVEKLEHDVREQKSDMGVIISQVLPKDVKSIGKHRSIWICGIHEFEGVAAMLREAVLKIHESKISQENKGDKMVRLYDYLNSNEFKQKWDAILSGFKNMKDSIDKQRKFYNNTLAEQEQIANGILINANNFLGSIKGIAGASMDEMKLLE